MRHTDHMTNAHSRRISTPKLVLAAVILCVLGISIAASPSVRFFKALYQDSVLPIAEFDANTTTLVTLPDANTRFTVMILVADLEDPMPAVDLTIESDGTAIQTTESNVWQSIMGHHYRTVAAFTAPESLTCTITTAAEDTADFRVFRHHTDTFQYRTNLVLPWWIGAAVPLLGGLGLIFFSILRLAFQKDDLLLEL